MFSILSFVDKSLGLAAASLLVAGLHLLLPAKVGDPLPAKVGDPAPAFSAHTLDGNEIQLSDLKGKIVLLDFWASWCGPCREEMPFLVGLRELHKSAGFEVIAVNIDDEVENAKDFLANLKRRVPFPIVVDPDKKLPELYKIRAMPTSLIIDEKGVIRFWHDGFKDSYRSLIRDELSSLLDKG